jgi:hypothetical protein
VPDAIADLVRASAELAVGTLDDWTWIQPTMGNLPPTSEPRSVLASFDERYGGPYVSADLSGTPFQKPNSVTLDVGNSGCGHWNLCRRYCPTKRLFDFRF